MFWGCPITQQPHDKSSERKKSGRSLNLRPRLAISFAISHGRPFYNSFERLQEAKKQDLGQRIPPGHAQVLTRDLALELDVGKTQQDLEA